MAIDQGDQFPAVSGETYQGERIDLADFRGKKNVVLYFYPRDLTPGCTREAIDFDRRLDQFAAADTVVIGMSVDPPEAHQSFTAACGLHFPLLSDTDRSLSRTLGILNDNGTHAKRTTFVVDKQGAVHKIFQVSTVDGHADEVLATVQKLS